PSPDQQPNRTMEPGACSRYQEKSSPPDDCGACTIDCGSIALAADAISAVATSSLSTGGTPRWYVSSCITPHGAKSCSTNSWKMPEITRQIPMSAVRQGPDKKPVCGIALGA